MHTAYPGWRAGKFHEVGLVITHRFRMRECPLRGFKQIICYGALRLV